MGVIRDEFISSGQAVAHVAGNRGLRRLFIAYTDSLVGNGVFTLTVAVVVFRAGGAAAVGELAVARYIAIALASPVITGFLDQRDRRRTMAVAESVRCLCNAIVVLCVLAHWSVLTIAALVIIKAVAGVGFYPTQMAILPELSRSTQELEAANVLTSTVEGVGIFAGPALAGLLLAVSGPAAAFALSTAGFAVSATLSATVPLTAPSDRDDDINELLRRSDADETLPNGFFARALVGLRTVRGDRRTLSLIGLYVLQCVVYGASTVFTVAIALRLLGLGSSGLGLMESVLGVGGLLGGFASLILVERSRLAWDFGLAVLAWGSPLLLIAFYPRVDLVLAVVGFIGLANSVVDINYLTVIEHMVPNDRLGRVLGAIEAGEVVGMAIGAVAMTAMINAVGLRTGLAVIGLVASAITVPILPTMRRIDRELFNAGVRHHPHHIRRHRHTRFPLLHDHMVRRLRSPVHR